ncbi:MULTISPECIES: hypothetical protein [unclassified Lacticaseibacillus]|uniref:hypothetical protein n=1 Tax=unclassified Lacticaseibacillus TaxID=2759744 RepID=UPI00194333EF|nr:MULTISPECIES: hypothetical protein [unclassified Lacticaseibacillus]
MLDVKNSIDNLEWTTTHHLAHIQNQHPFMRRWAVQFELAYTDFRVIQMALQLDGQHHELLADFSQTYETIHNYEFAFAGDGLEGFNQQYGGELDEYASQVDHFEDLLDQIRDLEP